MAIKTSITMRVDRDVLEYFRQQGAGYQTRMNDVLKGHVEAMVRISEVEAAHRKSIEAGLTQEGDK
jgi:hypothetical protein